MQQTINTQSTLFNPEFWLMILDLNILMALIPFLLLIGSALIIYGKEILDVMAFPIGALAGGILAYMILRGLLHGVDIPLWISLIVTIGMAIGGGIVGKGTTAMLLALFTATVIVDVIHAFVEDQAVLLVVIGLVLFLGLVALVPRFMEIFSSFLGAVTFTLGITPLLDGMDVVPTRLIQLGIILALTALGAFLQYYVYRKLAQIKEQITWIPTKKSSA
jgi:hypothetical protein